VYFGTCKAAKKNPLRPRQFILLFVIPKLLRRAMKLLSITLD
jgi:hypothetical protein